MSNKDFSIAKLSTKEQTALSEAEALFKAATGKDCVLIAWEEK